MEANDTPERVRGCSEVRSLGGDLPARGRCESSWFIGERAGGADRAPVRWRTLVALRTMKESARGVLQGEILVSGLFDLASLPRCPRSGSSSSRSQCSFEYSYPESYLPQKKCVAPWKLTTTPLPYQTLTLAEDKRCMLMYVRLSADFSRGGRIGNRPLALRDGPPPYYSPIDAGRRALVARSVRVYRGS